MSADGGTLLAFFAVLGIVHVGPMLLIWRAVRAAEMREERERELRAKDRVILARLGAAVPLRVERRPIGFARDDCGPRGDGGSGVIVIYSPPASDDTRGTVR